MTTSREDKEAAREMVNRCGGNRAEAARHLGISYQAVLRRIKGMEGVLPPRRGGGRSDSVDQEAELWKQYRQRPDADAVNRLIQYYDPQVIRIVARLAIPDWVDRDSILQEARLGLCECIRRYDGSTQFMTYALLRIRGAAIDCLRKSDPVARSVRELERQRKAIEAAGGDALAEMGTKYLKSFPSSQVSIEVDAFQGDRSDVTPLKDTLQAPPQLPELDRDGTFREICKSLSLEQQTIMFLYYVKSQTMHSIGGVLHLSESRVSQLHSEAIEFMRGRLDLASVA